MNLQPMGASLKPLQLSGSPAEAHRNLQRSNANLGPRRQEPQFGMDFSFLPDILSWWTAGIAAVGAVGASGFRIVHQSKVALVERLGKYVGKRNAGVTYVIPFIDKLNRVDVRETVLDLPQQAVITKENATMNIDAIIYYQITDPAKAIYEVKNLEEAIQKFAMTTVRNIIGEMTLDETLASRDKINHKLKDTLNEAASKWGIQVNRIELKDINPPANVQQAMQKEMEAERTRRASIITAEGNKKAAILQAEGQSEAAIRAAEGQKQAMILEAEGRKEAALREAEGKAQAIRQVQGAEAEMRQKQLEALKNANVSPEVLQLKAMEAMAQLGQGKANTIVVPSDASAMLGSLSAAARLLQPAKAEQTTEPEPQQPQVEAKASQASKS